MNANYIVKLTEKTGDEEAVFLFLLKKTCDAKTKKERLNIFNAYAEYCINKHDKLRRLKIHPLYCSHCGDSMTEGVCDNCESSK